VIRPRSLLAAFVALALLGILLRDDPRKLGATSFGYLPSGHRAVFELLVRLGWPGGRSYGPADLLPPSSVWWIEPRGLCDASPEQDDEPALRIPGQGDALVAFVERGGTAVVALSAQPSIFGREVAPCEGLGGVPLPPRDLPEPPPEEEGADDESSLGHLEDEVVAQQVAGLLSEGVRILKQPRLVAFEGEPEEGWRVRARVDGRPWLLDRSLEQGWLAVVADASFLRNGWLDAGDAAPLAVDLARAYGFDHLDERAHGLRFDDPDAVAFLAASPALPLFLGLALLGALVFWWGSARPAPVPVSASMGAPTLEGFVGALAALYGSSRDYARLAERYRVLSLARLRRHFGLPSDTPPEAVLARLSRHGRLDEAALGALRTTPRVASAGEFARQVRRFDAIVEEGSR
jgi:hypothetical protein